MTEREYAERFTEYVEKRFPTLFATEAERAEFVDYVEAVEESGIWDVDPPEFLKVELLNTCGLGCCWEDSPVIEGVPLYRLMWDMANARCCS